VLALVEAAALLAYPEILNEGWWRGSGGQAPSAGRFLQYSI